MSKVGRPKGSGNYPIRFNLFISESMNEDLKKISKKYNVTISELIRKTMERVIKNS